MRDGYDSVEWALIDIPWLLTIGLGVIFHVAVLFPYLDNYLCI